MSNSDKFTFIPSVYLILDSEKMVLLSRRFRTGFEDGNYGLVSGHLEGKETLREAMSREAREEVDIVIKPDDLKHVLTMHRWCGDHERIDFFFTCKKYDGEIQNAEPDKCDDLHWFKISDLPDNTIPYIREAINCYVTGKQYSEFCWS